jgi:hypothetical protein
MNTIYLITYHAFNHGSAKPNAKPLDPRFLQSDKNYIYYLIDQETPRELSEKQVVHEHRIDPLLYRAGAEHLGEWSFLLAEERHAFCQYPFFMISSRFYEKNHWLKNDLTQEWEKLFSQFAHYRYGLLPSYDRPLRWFDLNWPAKLKKEIWRHIFFPWKEDAFSLIKRLYDVDVPSQYRFVADLFCNYIGFRDRQALLDYTHFYRPLIDFFFDENFALKKSLEPYVRKTGSFRKEKPFTLLLEIFSHLYFYAQNEKVFSLHYDGYYEVDEKNTQFTKIAEFTQPSKIGFEQLLRWTWRRWKTEGFLAPLYAKMKGLYRA